MTLFSFMIGIRLGSGRKKEHRPKLLGLDIFRWGGGLPHKGVGAKKFDMCLETRELSGVIRANQKFE